MGGCHSRSGQYSSGLPDPATVHRKDIEPTGATSGSFRQRPAQLRRVHTDPLFDVVALSAPGAFAVAADDGGITVYNWLNTSDVVSWRAHERSVNRLAWSASASMLASCSRDTSVKLWSVGVDVPLHTLAGHTLTVSAVDFSPDSLQVASGSRDTSVRVWDVSTGKESARNSAQLNVVTDVKWLTGPLSTIVAQASEDLNVKLWDTRTPGVLKCTGKLDGYVYFPLCMDVSWDGSYLLTSSKGFNSVGAEARLWDLRTMTEISQFCGHEFDTVACAFLPASPGGRQRIVTASKDCTIRIWDQHTGECIIRHQDNTAGSISSVAVLPLAPSVPGGEVASGVLHLAVTTITAGVFVYAVEDSSSKLRCVAKCEPAGSV